MIFNPEEFSYNTLGSNIKMLLNVLNNWINDLCKVVDLQEQGRDAMHLSCCMSHDSAPSI